MQYNRNQLHRCRNYRHQHYRNQFHGHIESKCKFYAFDHDLEPDSEFQYKFNEHQPYEPDCRGSVYTGWNQYPADWFDPYSEYHTSAYDSATPLLNPGGQNTAKGAA